MAPPAEPLDFAGGAVGYFGYDLVRTVERLPGQPPDDLGVPDLIALVTGPVVVFDHLKRSLTIVAPCAIGRRRRRGGRLLAHRRDDRRAEGAPLGARAAPGRHGGRAGARAGHEQRRPRASSRRRSSGRASTSSPATPSRSCSRSASRRRCRSTRSRSTARCARSTRRRTCSTSRRADVTLVGSSPELLVRVETATSRCTRSPAPGRAARPRTRTSASPTSCSPTPRSAPSTSCWSTSAATTSGACREIGTVRVTELMEVERYTHVMHIVSSVVGRLAAGRRRVRRAARDVPGRHAVGRAQGARDGDHRRARAHRARPLRRRGRLPRLDGGLDTCITIRTIVCRDGVAYVQAGAGIVADSVPATEYEETPEQGRRAAPRDRGRRGPGGLVSRWPRGSCSSTTTTRFTYNLVQYLRRAGRRGARAPQRRASTSRGVAAPARRRHRGLARARGRPTRRASRSTPSASCAGSVPILGVCLGHQAIGEVFGGTRRARPRAGARQDREIHHDGRTVVRRAAEPVRSRRATTRWWSTRPTPPTSR